MTCLCSHIAILSIAAFYSAKESLLYLLSPSCSTPAFCAGWPMHDVGCALSAGEEAAGAEAAEREHEAAAAWRQARRPQAAPAVF